MFGLVQLESSDHVFAFIAFLQANPELKQFVHTIVATPAAFGPSPLYLLPNLSSIECVDESQLEEPEDEDTDEGDDRGEQSQNIPDYTRPQTAARARAQRSLVVHHASLACFAQLGARVRTLRLSSVSLPTLLSFAQMLVALASVTRLVCEEVEIQAECGAAPLEVAVQRLAERIQLKELVIDSHSLARRIHSHAPCSGALLLDPRLAPSVVESLVVEVCRLDHFPPKSEWCRLQRLELQVSSEASVSDVAHLLERFSNTAGLRDVLIKSSPGYQGFVKLDHALLRFPKPRITFVIAGPTDAGVLSFWTRELENHLPMLLEHGGAVTVECSELEGLDPSAPPHHDGVQVLAVSPDSKWVASGSLDSTIVLRDAVSGAVAQRWAPHTYKPVRSLAFSPESQYVFSGGDDGKAVVWDLSGSTGVCKYTMLEGHAGPVLTSAWSLNRGTIATGCEDGALKGAVVSIAFSSDGSWLACGSRRGECCIVNVASGTLHRSLWNSSSGTDHDDDDLDSGGSYAPPQTRGTIVAFDPTSGSTRLATAPCGSCFGINTVDVQTGSILAYMGGKRGEFMRMHDISFSPDGTLILGISGTSVRNGVYVWDAASGVERFELTGHVDTVLRARFSPCGRRARRVLSGWEDAGFGRERRDRCRSTNARCRLRGEERYQGVAEQHISTLHRISH
uniref:Uncharacterized protein n=1 Tax=Ganoderma boninense TaxID=34458 RepID=A0A5K1K7B6_9APHY|nr:Uncharacterized protein [Ganoderma boninense]